MDTHLVDNNRIHTSSEDTDIASFLSSLNHEAITHLAVNHPYLKTLEQGDFYDHEKALKNFALQYHCYQENFIAYLSAVIARLEIPNHRHILVQNLMEESGFLSKQEVAKLADLGIEEKWVQGISHTDLFKRFMFAMGVDDMKLNYQDELNGLCWRETFSGILLNGTVAEAIGAISFATENIVSHMYQYIVAAIKLYGKIDRKDSVFFELHTLVDDHHQQSLLTIAEYYAKTEKGRKDLHKGMRKALNLRVSFWDSMYMANSNVVEVSECA